MNNTYYTWQKGELRLLSQHFKTTEFDCPCNDKRCLTQKINIDLVNRIERMRQKLNEPLSITSGYRCQFYQDDLTKRGYETAKNSQHLLGNAVDLTSRSFKTLVMLADQEFKAMGTGRTFIHVDLRDDKARRWTYR